MHPIRAQAAIESSSGSTAGSLLGQAAMEYLVTYGWALLALMLIMAMLLSSGAFSANSFAVQECTFQPDLPCSAFILYRSKSSPSLSDYDQTTLQFRLSNGLGFPINVTGVTYTANDLGGSGTSLYTGTAPAGTFGNGAEIPLAYDFTGTSQPSGRAFKTVQVSLSYRNAKSGSGPYVTSGRVSAIVEVPSR